MANKAVRIFVGGMSCSACEARIERALLAIPGAIRAKASRWGGTALFEYDEALAQPEAAKRAIEGLGYQARDRRGLDTPIALGAGLVLAAAYLAASSAGLFSFLPRVDASIGYGMLFVAGILTSVHCVAMCGGIALSQGLSSPSSGILYNLGRILSYALVGGMAGALGSAFSFSPAIKGGIAAMAGLFMLYLGLKMLGILPGLPKLDLRLPAGAGASLGRIRSFAAKRGPFAIGLLNGLMPCGPLQTMQLYALGTGSFLAGALSLLIFSLGTLPLMLVFSLAAALFPKKLLPAMVKAGAVLVMVLGVVTLSRAANLAGISLPAFALGGALSPAGASLSAALLPGTGAGTGSGSPAFRQAAIPASATKATGIKATLENGVQTVTTRFTGGRYVPFTVQAGVPLKWTIRVGAGDLTGCNNPMTLPAYGITKTLVPGDNLVEFTPKAPGSITYTCWMGMVSSRITVVASLAETGAAVPGKADPRAAAATASETGSGPGSGLGACCAKR
jgi:sulfite exporter TauE/SafE/copper chaperone CopZ